MTAESLSPRLAATPRLEVGVVGTFDVENYGDLLFPLLARAELSRRLRAIDVTAYSYNARSRSNWPCEIRPIAEFLQGHSNAAGLLIGGGQLVRTDSHFPIAVPPGTIAPFDIWLYPAVAALALGIPVVWNAIGAWKGGVAFSPAVREIFRAAANASDCVAVRDAITAQVFDSVAGRTVASQVPDTAFGLRSLVQPETPSAAFLEWRRQNGVNGRYVAIQATQHLAPLRGTLLELRHRLHDAQFVLLPICKVHGDRASLATFAGLGALDDDHWHTPQLFAEIIANAALAIGSSLHFGITALAFRVPLLRVPGYDDRKYEMLDGFAGAQWLGPGVTRDTVARLAEAARADDRVTDSAQQVDRYWDAVAQLLGARARAGNPRPDRRPLAAWATRQARRQAATFQSANIRFRYRS